MSLRTLLASVLLVCSFTAVAATEVIPLNYRTSDDLMPTVKSFLGNEGTVNAYGNKLIVNAEPAKIGELRDLLSQLDTAPKRLMISVDTSDNTVQNDQGYSVNGTVRSQNGRVSADGKTRIINYGTASRDGGVQQVQANEGTPALIQVGQSIPITNVQTDSYGYAQTNTQYRNVTRGFYVTATITGDIVHLNISTNNDRMSQQQADAIKVQSTDTQVSGRLGEWITLAGVSDQSRADEQGVTRRYSTQGRDDMTLRVKVDSLD
ncbi:secretin N-terminal domain-containing protein [Pseudomonas sp. SLFW]|uniref:secretin N-terminal domain-containing protein n=1 Tax=Pseudomonas sp. SLFW TaxID=2683259 RepID=UPI0014128B31|nr:secretin N-terminal domain-containing protein [Pseudomonas sp. SLFW]NBB09628.1 secretin [Pseudomonas sp. SLFW]